MSDQIVEFTRSKKIGIRLLFVAAMVATFIAGFYTVENWRWQRAWDEYVQARKTAGLWIEGDAPLPPAKDNYAMIPLLRPLVGPGPLVTNAAQVVISRQPHSPQFHLKRTNDDSGIIKAFLGNRDRTQPVNLTALQTYYRGGTNFPPGKIQERSLQKYLENLAAGPTSVGVEFPVAEKAQSAAQDVILALSRYDEWLTRLTEALDRPHAVFQTNFGPYGITLRHLSVFQGVERVLRIRAVARLANREPAAALDDILNTYRISLKFTEDPLLISLLVRGANLERTHHAVWEGLRDRRWQEDQLRQLQQFLETIDLFRHLSVCLRGERALEAKLLVQSENERKPLMQFPHFQNEPEHERRYNRFMKWAPAGWFASGSLEIGLIFDEIDQAVTTDRTIPGLTNVVTRYLKLDQNSTSPTYLAATRYYNLDHHWSRVCRTQVNVNLTITACALERYHLANGKYPKVIAELIPKFIKAVPIDHADGKPLRYRLTEDGRYRVYSIGLNLIDDGGTIAPGHRSVDESVWAYAQEERDWKLP